MKRFSLPDACKWIIEPTAKSDVSLMCCVENLILNESLCFTSAVVADGCFATRYLLQADLAVGGTFGRCYKLIIESFS